jgi:hypothetical protein
MTAREPFTRAKVKRAIAAARASGLRVVGIRPDGVVLVQEGDAPVVPGAEQQQDAPATTSWDDR